jgi:hypothetical protein
MEAAENGSWDLTCGLENRREHSQILNDDIFAVLLVELVAMPLQFKIIL